LEAYPVIWTGFTSGFFTSSFGTVTVSTPFSIEALTSLTLAFSGSRKRRRKLPLLRSTRCHFSFLSSFSFVLCPLIWSTLPSSISTFTSSFFSPGRSALNTCASGVSFQSMRVLAIAAVSLETSERGKERAVSNGSQTSREKGSKTLVLRPVPKKLGMSDIVLRELLIDGSELGCCEWDFAEWWESGEG